jgi:hypothetical protein
MADELRLAKADIKKADTKKAAAAKVPVTMRGLWRLVSWGTTAAACLLVAVLASRGGVGSQRAAVAVATIKNGTIIQPSAPVAQQPSFDAQAETKRLSEAVRELASENDQLKARLGMVEHSMDDVTGTIAQQQASQGNPPATPAVAPPPAPAPWPDGAAPAPTTAAAIAAVVAPALPLPMEYGADLGGGTSMAALRARWAGIRSAHPHVFDGLAPTVSLGQMAPPNRPELRLVVGPLPSADAAERLCASLNRSRLTCQPTIFGGQHVALE